MNDTAREGDGVAVTEAMVERGCAAAFEYVKTHEDYVGDPSDTWESTEDEESKDDMRALVRVAIEAAMQAQQGAEPVATAAIERGARELARQCREDFDFIGGFAKGAFLERAEKIILAATGAPR